MPTKATRKGVWFESTLSAAQQDNECLRAENPAGSESSVPRFSFNIFENGIVTASALRTFNQVDADSLGIRSRYHKSQKKESY